ncbi:MAG: carboxypeptidase regulatory-like domain-containing protein [Janthinobacterium lividum]
MQKHEKKRVGLTVALAAGALIYAVAGAPAWAQNAPPPPPSNDAGDQAAQGMPETQQQGDVSFVSGGVGLDESHALRAAAGHWPLSLQFIGPGREYVSDVRVRITDGQGNEVLNTDSHGPYMLVRLHPGHYTIHAKHGDAEQTRTVDVSGAGSAKASFSWRG